MKPRIRDGALSADKTPTTPPAATRLVPLVESDPQETLRTVRAVCEAKGVDDASKVSVIWGLVALVPGYDADEWEVRRWTDTERYNRLCEAERERRAEASEGRETR